MRKPNQVQLGLWLLAAFAVALPVHIFWTGDSSSVAVRLASVIVVGITGSMGVLYVILGLAFRRVWRKYGYK